MKIGLAFLSVAFLIPSAVLAIELDAERECRQRLWGNRVGALVSFDVSHPLISRSSMTGLLERVQDDQLDFGTFQTKADRVLEKSVVVPKKGDLVAMNILENGSIVYLVTIFNRVENGLLYGDDLSVPVANIVAGLSILQPGTDVYVEYYRPGSGHWDNRKAKNHLTLAGVDGRNVVFDGGLTLPLNAIVRMHRSPR